MFALELLLEAVCDAAARKIVRRKLHGYLVTRKNAYIMHSHFAGDMGQNNVPILKFYVEHCIGERLDYRTLQLYCICLAQITVLY